jgi:hypothetical protein
MTEEVGGFGSYGEVRKIFILVNGSFVILESLVSTVHLGGPGRSVGIATVYGLDGPGIESRCSRDFPHKYRPDLGLTQPPVQWVPGFPRG